MKENMNTGMPSGQEDAYASYADCPTGMCGHGNYLTVSNQPTNKPNVWQQPMPLQTLPLFLEQPQTQPAMQPQMQSVPMQSAPMNYSPMMQPIREAPSQARFTDFEQLRVLSDNIPITAESLQYLNGFLRTQIGRRVKVEFLIGTNSFVDKDGILLGVGVNYILINETDTDDLTACDFYNIKFIKFYY